MSQEMKMGKAWDLIMEIHNHKSKLNATLLALTATEAGPDKALKALDEMVALVIEYKVWRVK